MNNLFKLHAAAVDVLDQHGRPGQGSAAPAQPSRRTCCLLGAPVEVITRRTENRLKKARHREHILEGRIKALDVIDEIIKLIRASDDVARS